jgi:hypothetical protein
MSNTPLVLIDASSPESIKNAESSLSAELYQEVQNRAAALSREITDFVGGDPVEPKYRHIIWFGLPVVDVFTNEVVDGVEVGFAAESDFENLPEHPSITPELRSAIKKRVTALKANASFTPGLVHTFLGGRLLER